jgi:hypothetical protein
MLDDHPPPGLVPLRSAAPRAGPPRRRRTAETTHELRDLSSLIRVCFVDTILQTGGAEWFASELALVAHPGAVEVVFVTWRSADSPLAQRLREGRIAVVDACSSSGGAGVPFDEWTTTGVFDQLELLSPDIVFFSSQILFGHLPADRLA